MPEVKPKILRCFECGDPCQTLYCDSCAPPMIDRGNRESDQLNQLFDMNVPHVITRIVAVSHRTQTSSSSVTYNGWNASDY